MSKQVHFVVYADLETKTWHVDDNTFMDKFSDNEGTWNSETEDWEETEWDDNIAALDILNQLTLEDTQRLLKVAGLLEQSEINEAYTELLEFIAERGINENSVERKSPENV
jgi:hypothetical protein